MPIKTYTNQNDLTAEVFRRLASQGMTTSQIAKAISVPPPRVSEWKAGKYPPNPANLDALAGLLGLKVGFALVRNDGK